MQACTTNVPVAFRPSLFMDERELIEVPIGTSLADIIAGELPEREMWHLLRVAIDGWEVPLERWASTRPKRPVEIVVIPGGGGSTLRIVLMVAIIAIAVAAGAWIAAPAGVIAGTGLGVTGAAAAGAVATAAISAPGFLAMNALATP